MKGIPKQKNRMSACLCESSPLCVIPKTEQWYFDAGSTIPITEHNCSVLGMIFPGCEYYIVLFSKKWFDRDKVRIRILIDPFSLYEVNHVSLASIFGSLLMTV